MQPALSKRVAKITDTKYFALLDPDKKIAFLDEVVAAKNYNALSDTAKKIIERGEAAKNAKTR